jgi:putative transposase
MARLPRLTVPGLPHHLIQRGNNRQSIFIDEVDCGNYLRELRELATAHRVAIHAYVLMPNHVHLIVTPGEHGLLGRMMQALGRRYVRRFNDRHKRTGTLWEGRYRSTVIEADRYLVACMRYVELNPVRAGLVEEPALFRWSSHAHHVGLRVDPVVTEHAVYWALGNTPFERQVAYRRLFEHGNTQPHEEVAAIRYATNRGWALGDDRFARELSQLARRRANPMKVGRPRKPLIDQPFS